MCSIGLVSGELSSCTVDWGRLLSWGNARQEIIMEVCIIVTECCLCKWYYWLTQDVDARVLVHIDVQHDQVRFRPMMNGPPFSGSTAHQHMIIGAMYSEARFICEPCVFPVFESPVPICMRPRMMVTAVFYWQRWALCWTTRKADSHKKAPMHCAKRDTTPREPGLP